SAVTFLGLLAEPALRGLPLVAGPAVMKRSHSSRATSFRCRAVRPRPRWARSRTPLRRASGPRANPFPGPPPPPPTPFPGVVVVFLCVFISGPCVVGGGGAAARHTHLIRRGSERQLFGHSIPGVISGGLLIVESLAAGYSYFRGHQCPHSLRSVVMNPVVSR